MSGSGVAMPLPRWLGWALGLIVARLAISDGLARDEGTLRQTASTTARSLNGEVG